MGEQCDEFDISAGGDRDLLDQEIWFATMKIAGAGDFYPKLGEPSCSTFSNARRTTQ